MSIQELGSLGEFIGAIAVMVTLVYLAIQTRLTRKAAEVTQIAAEETAKFSRQQMTQGVVEMYSRWRIASMRPELAEILVKAKGSEPLTDAEQGIFSSFFEELFFISIVSYESAVESASIHGESTDTIHLLDVINANPKAIDEWRRMRPALAATSPRFIETIDRLLEEQGIVNQNDKSEI